VTVHAFAPDCARRIRADCAYMLNSNALYVSDVKAKIH